MQVLDKTSYEEKLQLKCSEDHGIDKPYKSLMHIMPCVHQDTYHIVYLGRFQQHPFEDHWSALKKNVDFRWVR